MSKTTADLVRADCSHVLHPWADLATLGSEPPMMIVEASGVRVTDEKGRSYLDAIGGMWCMTVGYGRRELIDAMRVQAQRMPYYTPFGAMANEPSAELAARLASLAPGDLKRVHFTTCGSTAVESALRFVHYYFGATGRPQKKHIISRVNAYHGSTYLAASISGKRWDRTCFQYEDTFVHLLQSPNPGARPGGMSIDDFCDRLVDEFEQLIATIGAERIACFISEPILASGGVIVPPPGYHRRMFEVCRRHDVLYVCDEVVTGMGRLGHFFASEARFGVVPDVIVCAKGLTSGYQPLGAVLISERLLDEISGARAYGHGVFTNGFTYAGHPVACAVALANLDLMEREDVCGHVRDVGPYFQARLEALREFPAVREIRGDHLMACIECKLPGADEERFHEAIAIAQHVDAFCQADGLLVRPYENLCILSPPLVITHDDVDSICATLERALMSVSNGERAWADTTSKN
jgi:putrescine---pyruvate transaminase